jgi:hypothetical protein
MPKLSGHICHLLGSDDSCYLQSIDEVHVDEQNSIFSLLSCLLPLHAGSQYSPFPHCINS